MATKSMGERIRELRLQKGISLRELARRADVSRSFLSDIEVGRSYPSEDALERIARELGVSPANLRKLDKRSHVSELRDLLQNNPVWGVVFMELAAAARSGRLTPEEALERIRGGKQVP
ncbi:MAG: helix-turn-helix domain-containing protein [Armatimonadetes bacterium]|nr:helix-turn-helix domain-containing protein [Akkermansiaceae bacterium]